MSRKLCDQCAVCGEDYPDCIAPYDSEELMAGWVYLDGDLYCPTHMREAIDFFERWEVE